MWLSVSLVILLYALTVGMNIGFGRSVLCVYHSKRGKN